MEIIKVNKSHEKVLFAYMQDNEHEYFLLTMDYKLNPDNNHLFMAIDQNQKIHGLFQVLFGQIQVRGSIEAVQTFLKYAKEQEIEVRELTGMKLHQNFLSGYFSAPIMKVHKYRMIFLTGNENLTHPQNEYQRLEVTEENKEKIASVIRTADPKHWGGVQSAHLVIDSSHPYFVIMGENGDIMSLAGLWFDEKMGLINVIATHPDYRKKGYATSLLSTSVEWLLQRSKKIIIDVRTSNAPAIRIYQKAGFQIGFEYVVYTLSDKTHA